MDISFILKNGLFNYRVAGIWINNNHVLLHKAVRDKHWALPGGKAMLLEDSQTTIKREMYEELKVNVIVNHLLWFVESFFEYDNKNYHEIGLYYSILVQNSLSYMDREAFYGVEDNSHIYKWFPINSLNDIPLYPKFLRNSLINIPEQTQYICERLEA